MPSSKRSHHADKVPHGKQSRRRRQAREAREASEAALTKRCKTSTGKFELKKSKRKKWKTRLPRGGVLLV